MRLIRMSWLFCISKYVVPANRLVDAKEYVAFPFRGENAFRGAAFVPAVRVNRPPSLRGPTNDFEVHVVRVVDKTSVSVK